MFFVEGNIGAGKSTFLKLVQRHAPEILSVTEPLSTWDDNDPTKSLLFHFGDNPNRWAHTMETGTMLSRVREHTVYQQITDRPVLMERSIYSGYHIFAYNSHAQGFMGAGEWHAYRTLIEMMVYRVCKAPEGFIYLRLSPERAYERACKRMRDTEANSVSIDYLRRLHDRHERFLLQKECDPTLRDLPVLTIDCEEEFEGDQTRGKQHVETAVEFMQRVLKDAR